MALDPGMQAQQMDPAAMQQGMGGGMSPDAAAGAMSGGPLGSMPQGQPSVNQLGEQDGQPGGDPYDGDSDNDEMENMVDFALSQANLAKHILKKKPEMLEEMGQAIFEGYIDDEQSRADWMKQNDEAMKLALLIRENKTYPWPKASNVKYPLIATAAMQFSARAYPSLVPSVGGIVKAQVGIVDQQGELEKAAIRVGKHMSYQISCHMPYWEEEMDKLLMTIAVSGICFKKTYYHALCEEPVSQIVYPENLCVNYWAKSLDKAYRKTEILNYNKNEILEKVQNDEEFLDIEYPDSAVSEVEEKRKPIVTTDRPVKSDQSTPQTFLACHTWWDLDEDGYEEPYIITVHKQTKKVVRIIARWDSDGVYKNEKGKIVKIKPVEYFTDFPFVPNPDGSIYALGFGMLLGPLNEAVNTLVNQLVDAGTLSNLQSGFIGRNLRIKEGQLQLRPGEWKVVNATGEELGKSFFPIPAKEPSNVLMSLLQMLITSGNQLASIAEIFVGKMPGQNTPATTTQETIQQGMAVFTAIYKRVYRSLAKEFSKLFRLNRLTPNIVAEESKVVGGLQASDYQGTEHLIIPGADPTGDSAAMRAQKLQQVGQLIQLGTINPMVYTQRMIDNLEIPGGQELIAQPQPPAPDPKAQTEQLKQQTMQQKAQLDSQAKQQDMQIKERAAALDNKAQMDNLDARERMLQIEAAHRNLEAVHKRQMNALDLNHTSLSKKLDLVLQTMKAKQEVESGNMQAAQEDAQAQRDMAREEQIHNQKMQLMQEESQARQQATVAKPKAKPKAKKKAK